MITFLAGAKAAVDEYDNLKTGEDEPIDAFVFALFTGAASKILGAPYYAATTIGLIGYKIYKGEAKELIPAIIRKQFGI